MSALALVTNTNYGWLMPDTYDRARFRGGVLLDEIATPATPSAGTNSLYAKSNHGLYVRNELGEEQKLNRNTADHTQGISSLLSYSLPPYQALSNGDALTSARAFGIQMPWHTTETVGNYYVYVGVLGATLSATGLQCSIWLCTGAGVLIAGSATASQSVAWVTTGLKTAAPSAGPLVVPADPLGYIYAVILATGTTPPTFRGSNPGASLCNLGLTAGSDPLRFSREGAATKTAPGTIQLFTSAVAMNASFIAVGN